MTDVEISGPAVDRANEVLTPQAVEFVAELQRTFSKTRDQLVGRRRERRDEIARTGRLDFRPGTKAIRDDPTWRVATAPVDLVDRRVEITGPTDRKMAINALNSGARVWLADFEDANTPHWHNVVGGQVNLLDAVRRTISLTAEGKHYRLRDDGRLAVIVVRPRGWHLDERHVIVDGRSTVGAFVDFGLYFFHNAKELLRRGSGPYFYLPKMESHLEARLWHDVFSYAEDRLGIPYGTIRATVLIETFPAAFEMEEILYELRDHASGLNAGRWDYLFSLIKSLRDAGPQYVLPDRADVTMTAPFMRAYTELLVRTCHKRGAFAMGGMAAFIPSRRDPEINALAIAKVRADKAREAEDGFDGSWVAHPDLVPVCQEVFDVALGERPNQLFRQRDEVSVSADDLMNIVVPDAVVTEKGLWNNVSVALQYLASWLSGSGAVAIYNLMEDAATAEIARSQIWQWVYNAVRLDTGVEVTADFVRRVVSEELDKIQTSLADNFDEARFGQARGLFEQVALAPEFVEFLTIPAYELID